MYIMDWVVYVYCGLGGVCILWTGWCMYIVDWVVYVYYGLVQINLPPLSNTNNL